MSVKVHGYTLDIDETDVTVLEETLLKINALTDQMTTSLHKLGTSAAKAGNEIRPIAGESKRMAMYERNLQESLDVVHGIKDYATVTEQCEGIIIKGPEAIGVPEYALTIEKLKAALEDLQSANMQTFYKVIEKANMLVRKGNSELKDYFRRLISQVFTPVDASGYLKKDMRPPIINPQDISILKQLYAAFNQQDSRDADRMYFDACTNYIKQSLATLESKSHAPNTPPAPSIAQLASSINSGSTGSALPNSTGDKTAIGPNSVSSSITSVSKAPPYERGSNAIIKYAEALCLLLTAEVENSAHLFPNKKDTATYYYEQISDLSLNDFVKIVRELVGHVKMHLATDSMLVFEVLDSIIRVVSVVKLVLKEAPKSLLSAFSDTEDTCHIVFKDFIKYIDVRVQNMISLPSDNGVCDVTIDVMSKMKRFADYKDPALDGIGSMSPGEWIPKPKPQWYITFTSSGALAAAAREKAELLSSYFSDAIDALFVCLEIKAKSLQKRNTQTGFFLLTNLTLIERYVTKSDIYMILGSAGSERIEKLRKRGLNLFLEGYVTLFLPYLLILMCILDGKMLQHFSWM